MKLDLHEADFLACPLAGSSKLSSSKMNPHIRVMLADMPVAIGVVLVYSNRRR